VKKRNFGNHVAGAGFLVCALLGTCFAQSTKLEGIVHDSTGAVITNARVTASSGAFKASAQTDGQGKFEIANVPASQGKVQVSAAGFATVTKSWNAVSSASVSLDITLQPASLNEQIVVSAARTQLRLSEAPGSTVVLSSTDLASTAALASDDVLRQIPGFALFRRSSSRIANPTSQGVSLRGLGASGPSRAAVLEDGIPLTDPFGGWVYWDRVPSAELSSVEVFRGGASSLYGNNALGGVIQFITRQPNAPAFSVETSYGSEDTPSLSLWGGMKHGRWDFDGGTDTFRSDGYALVPVALRGTVDTPANSEHGTLDFGVGHELGSDGRVFLRSNLFDEARHNGTPVQVNDTHIAEGSAGLDKQLGTNDTLSARIYADIQSYNQSFSSIAADRNSESLTNLQHVPAQSIGGNAQWTHRLGRVQTLIAGTELQETMGASDEQIFSSGTHTANNVAGGRQRTLGVFGEDILQLHRWTFIFGGRVDHWGNFNGSSIRTPVSTSAPPTGGFFADRSQTAFSPRLSVLRSLTNNLSVTASMYRAFRAPTLNELYRSFRLGNVLTDANSALDAERLTGAEAGLNATTLDRRLEMRGTFFWSDIVDPVSNVTLSTTPTLITRERENLGRTRSRGLELEGVAHVNSNIEFSAGYNFIDATVVQNPANTSLIGLEIPQVPRNQFTWSARYWNPSRIMFSVQGRFVGLQYDDDQNAFPLDRFYTMDLFIGRSLIHGVEVYAAAENLLDERYDIARTPTPNIGPPIMLRIGFRYNFPSEK
jgi:outer membrane receptor protein involved in Fe transport